MISDAGLPGDLLSIPRVTGDLLDLARIGGARDERTYRAVLERNGCVNPNAVFGDLRAAGFFTGREPSLTLSTKAHRTLLFVSGALGVPSLPLYDELRSLEPNLHRYELVRDGMTSRFIKGLLTEPGFQRLYLCSPWINLQKDDLGRLAVALGKAEEQLARPPEMLVLVQSTKQAELVAGLDRLKALGAQIVEKPKLHSKLYMREPGPRGGLSLAIVGSENLTRQKWLELGIEIRNDSYLLSKLRGYFFDIYGRRWGE